MPMTYETDRGVFFDPNEIKLTKCLKCATPTTRRSPRSIAQAYRAGYGRMRIVSTHNVLTLCEKCDARWNTGIGLGFAGMAMPFAVPIGLVMLEVKLGINIPGQLIGFAVLAGIVLAIAMYIYALRVSIRVRSIDDDGLLGLDNIHPDVRSEIVEMGDAYKFDHR